MKTSSELVDLTRDGVAGEGAEQHHQAPGALERLGHRRIFAWRGAVESAIVGFERRPHVIEPLEQRVERFDGRVASPRHEVFERGPNQTGRSRQIVIAAVRVIDGVDPRVRACLLERGPSVNASLQARLIAAR